MEKVKDFCFDKVIAGKANSIPDFYDSIINKQFTNIDTIKRTHDALMSYLNMDNKTLFLRLYGSYAKDKYDLLRRGFLTEYPCKTKISFCDNTFSMLFTGLKLANIPLTNLKLSDYLSQSSLITSFGVTSKEMELSYYTSKNALRIDLNSKGWYLAHIKPVGYGYMDLDLKSLFPNPPRHEWNKETKIRISQSNLSDDQNRIIKAHFLRLIHPLNSFLLPKRNLINYDGSNLGEETELISYVSEKIKLIFKDQYDEFDTISMKYNFQPSNTNISNIEWVDYSKIYSNKSQLVNDIDIKAVNSKPKNTDGILPIILNPNDNEVFLETLLKTKTATITTFYKNGTKESKIWKAERMTAKSNVIGNLRSRKEFRNGNYQKANITKVIVELSNLSTKPMSNKGIEINPFEENTIKVHEAINPSKLKIGKYVQSTFRKVILKIDNNELVKLQNAAYSKITFDIQFPLLKKVSRTDSDKIDRYWKEPVEILGDRYWLCSEWYEKRENNDRPYYEKWLRKIENNFN